MEREIVLLAFRRDSAARRGYVNFQTEVAGGVHQRGTKEFRMPKQCTNCIRSRRKASRLLSTNTIRGWAFMLAASIRSRTGMNDVRERSLFTAELNEMAVLYGGTCCL